MYFTQPHFPAEKNSWRSLFFRCAFVQNVSRCQAECASALNTDALLTKAPHWEAQWLLNSLTNSEFTIHCSKSTEHFTLLSITSTNLKNPACFQSSRWESCAGTCGSFNPKSRTMLQTRCTTLKTARCIAGRKSELHGNVISRANNPRYVFNS